MSHVHVIGNILHMLAEFSRTESLLPSQLIFDSTSRAASGEPPSRHDRNQPTRWLASAGGPLHPLKIE